MWLTLLGLLKNRWVQYGIGAVALMAAALMIRQHYINLGKDAGREEVRQSSQQMIEQARAADREQTVKLLDGYKMQADEAQRRADVAEQQAAIFAQTARELAQQRQQIRNDVNKIPDADLHDHTVHALALRPATDKTPGYYPIEERAIASCVDELPVCNKQVTTQGNQIAEIKKQVTELGNKIGAMEARYTALAGYTIRLETHYTDLANLYPRRKRAIQCVWLWKCKANPLPVPDPKAILETKP